MADELDDFWHPAAQLRRPAMTVGQLRKRPAKLQASAVVMTFGDEHSVHPAGDGLAAVTRVVQLEVGQVLLATDERD